MSDRAAYSRVYWSVLYDPKFHGIRTDYRSMGVWTMLLIIADMAWPAPAFLPPVPKASLAKLVQAGLVDLVEDGLYRIHGLDAEREHRKALATTRGPSGHRPVTGRVPSWKESGHLDETSTRREELNETLTGRERAGARLVEPLGETA